MEMRERRLTQWDPEFFAHLLPYSSYIDAIYAP
jgi:hypothetical protein